ncbi:hypothetical protein OROGR_019530 [Orobanche gracilis]
MENSSSLILEISSDEEVGFGDTGKGSGCGVGAGEFRDRDDFDWLSELLVDDVDDVVLVSETSPNPSKKPRLAANVVGDDDDDDCVVLDGDPDNSVSVPAIGKVDTGGDVEIVGEKGEVACRDFPHARHLCAKYLFASTQHEVHCNQCHCYVCDSLAPCSYWGTGVSSIDHCHATDKDDYWRAERKRMKRIVNPVSAVPPINNNNPLLRPLFQPTQAPASPRPTVTRFFPMSVMSPNVTGPSAASQVRACSVQVYRPRTQFAPLQSPANKTQNLKPPGLVGMPKNYISPYVHRLSTNRLTNIVERTPLLKRCCAVKGHHGTHQLNTRNPPFLSRQQINNPQGIVNVARANYVRSRPYSSSLIRDALHQSQSETHSQPYLSSNSTAKDNNFVKQPRMSSQRSAGLDSLIFHPSHVFGPHSSVPYQNAQSYQSNAGNAFGSVINSRFPSNQNAPPQAHVNPAPLLFDIPNDHQQRNHAENGIGTSPNDFGLASEAFQCTSTGPTVTSQIHGVNENDNRQSIEPVGSFQQEGVVLEDNSSVTKDAGSLFPESIPHDMLDFQFDNWMFENHTLPGVLEAPASPLWDTFISEPASIDTGNLFDF